ncbi:MAG: PIN domain-containing protein [bacterium]
MKTVFVDANVFLRFFTIDNLGQHDQAARLLRQAADGKVALITGPPVLFEVAWALRSAYRQTNAKVLDVLAAIAALPGLQLTDARIVEGALTLAKASGQEFADAYIASAAGAVGADEVATFNRRHFDKLGVALYAF